MMKRIVRIVTEKIVREKKRCKRLGILAD